MPEPRPSAPSADLRHLPLESLELAPENVRSTPAGAAADAELKASIATHGILENLVVRPAAAGRFIVIAGGRRLAQARALAEDGVLDADHPVPCRIQPDAEDAHELSLAENVVRAAMHPADQVTAFRALADAGATATAIAARFGVSERTVAQRLRLGNAAPELLDAYRADEMDLTTLTAFALTTDHARQRAVWEETKAQGYAPSAWQVKRRLTEGRVPAGAAIARFVGVDAYEAAGGAVTRDLFADDDETGVWLDEPERVRALAMERLEAVAEELRTRWAWAEVHLDPDWSTTARYWRVHPEPCAPSDAERAELERLDERLEALAELDDDEWTEVLADEAEATQERVRAIETAAERRAVFRREDRAIAGCIVTIDDDGTLAVEQGLVRPEDRPTEAGSGAAAASNGQARMDPPALARSIAPTPDPEAAARKAAGIGIGLADDLRAIRTAIVKSALACDFEAAFDLLLFQLVRSVFGERYHDDALDIAARTTPDRPPVRSNDTDFARANVGEKFLAGDRAAHPLDWLDRPGAEAFASLRAMDDRHKRQLFASCVARTLKGQLAFEPSARPEVEATVARLDLDLASAVRSNHTPVWSAPLLWNRLPKARLLDIARSTLGDAWAAAHTKRKKAEIAQAMEAAFNSRVDAPGDVTPEARAAALAWVPPGFRAFDTGRTAEETPAGDAAVGSPTESPPTPDAGQDAAKPHGAASTDADIPTGGAGETSPENGADAPAPIKSLDAPGDGDVGALRPGAGTGHGPGWTPPGPGDSGDPQALPAFPRHSA